MKSARPHLGWIVMAGAALAAMIGGMIAAHGRGTASIQWNIWLASTGLGVFGAAVLWVSQERFAMRGTAGSVVACLSFAALVPLAAESSAFVITANLAVALACAGGAFLVIRSPASRIGYALCAAGACALDITALALPAGTVVGMRARRGDLIAVLGLSVVAAWAGASTGHPPVTSFQIAATAHLAHRDLFILLPAVLLGAGGWAKTLLESNERLAQEQVSEWHGWAIVSMPTLLLALAGYGVSVRLAVLTMWFWIPAGVEDLIGLVQSPQKPARIIGTMCIGAVAVLSAIVLRRWLDGVLLALFVLD